jgi:nitrite reductase/ring-hydroxylating ferredoxin subunit/uncharacterized membrane protein
MAVEAPDRPAIAPALRTGRWAETLLGRIERMEPLTKLARFLATLTNKVLPPGGMKDLVSGTWLAHPVHPMLTDVTIGAWTSALALDLFASQAAAADALIAIGVASAVPTAVTGLSDLADVESTPDRTIGGAHAVGNVAATALFATSFVARRRGRRGVGVALSLLGAGVATAAGFLGGDLAYRRGIGVDRTVFDERFPKWTRVMPVEELPDRTPTRGRAGRTVFLLYREGTHVYAIDNRCSHRGGPLDKGTIKDGVVTCPWHLSEFSLADGSIVRGPATAPQPAFELRIVDGSVEVRSR